MKNKLLVSIVAICIVIVTGVLFTNVKQTNASEDLGTRLSGQILLQVEENGEAWYINPDDHKRYYLGRPKDAFNIMRHFGLGATNKDLNYLPVGISGLSGTDTDQDGLTDDFEISQGTNVNLMDTDGDGFTDKHEILNNYSPLNSKNVKNYYDKSMQNRLSGKILLQVQSHGESWYIYPGDQNRYYLGRPMDAFNIMRNFGLGITNKDLETIEKGTNLVLELQTKESTVALSTIVPTQTSTKATTTHFGGGGSSKNSSGGSSSAGSSSTQPDDNFVMLPAYNESATKMLPAYNEVESRLSTIESDDTKKVLNVISRPVQNNFLAITPKIISTDTSEELVAKKILSNSDKSIIDPRVDTCLDVLEKNACSNIDLHSQVNSVETLIDENAVINARYSRVTPSIVR